MNRMLFVLTGWILFTVPPVLAQTPDALDEALAIAGLRRADLGWRPKGWWPKFPAEIPYKLRAFDSLLAEPLDTITYLRLLGNAARVHLDPSTINKEASRGSTNLHQAVHVLGINPKYGTMRGYATNLSKEDTSLEQALLNLQQAAGRTVKPFTFYMDLPYPQLGKEVAEKVQTVPEKARPILGRLIMNIIEAQRWTKLAFRNVDGHKRAIVARRYDIGHETVDGYDYCPEFDDVAQTLDQASLWYAAEKCVQALEDARIELSQTEELKNSPPFAFDWRSPWGWIRIHGGGDDTIDGTDSLLIVDLGGNDRYSGGVAAATPDRPIGLLLDCGGNDRYESETPAQGAGITGIGILIDADGNDEYRADQYAQGLGLFGFGLCADLSGDDQYFLKFNGQGCGYFGIGQLFDCDGHDTYTIWGDGQGLGGVAGVGVLADRRGDDTYTAVRSVKVTGRQSYHSPKDDVAVSNVQGCAIGRRGDGGDGHSWAGGLGALLDIEGNDKYISGNWCMGSGYWFGIGLLYDGTGNDLYDGVCYTQGASVHFSIGAMLDEGGDDKHWGKSNGNQSVGWSNDFSVGLLVDIGGNDEYEVHRTGLAHAINRSLAMLIDIGGDDTYRGNKGNRPGMAQPSEERYDTKNAERPPVSFYFADVTSLGLFLDIGGRDTYWSGQENNTHWTDEADSTNWKVRNFSIGVDREDGTVNFVPRPEKPPSLPRRE